MSAQYSVLYSVLMNTVETNWHRNDFFGDFVHHTRLSSPGGVYDVGMMSPSFEVHRDSLEKTIRGISFEGGIPCTYNSY